MTFRDREKERYNRIKPILSSPPAQANGSYRGKPRPFCLSDDCSDENLYFRTREDAIQYFLDRGITWHDGLKGRHLPSNHLCCSQSCCVNFLFPLMKQPDLIKAIFSQYYREIAKALPITEDKPLTDGTHPFIAFEWIGTRDYLEEAKRKRMRRTRGANFTSADFAFRFREKNGRIQPCAGRMEVYRGIRQKLQREWSPGASKEKQLHQLLQRPGRSIQC